MDHNSYEYKTLETLGSHISQLIPARINEMCKDKHKMPFKVDVLIYYSHPGTCDKGYESKRFTYNLLDLTPGLLKEKTK